MERRGTCKFYRELDAILGHRPASVPTSLLDTGNSSTLEESTEETVTSGERVDRGTVMSRKCGKNFRP